ncbi:uncharacterized protein LOC126792009 [Argentina anserina]|uniref:uncharacterized protein LOC126792009 n=1 Tax=Argentina anserina TaxID=57926 RepID=UPI002176212A|nr:uncharacterized protein LOC126792009 [Potentilla anserina]
MEETMRERGSTDGASSPTPFVLRLLAVIWSSHYQDRSQSFLLIKTPNLAFELSQRRQCCPPQLHLPLCRTREITVEGLRITFSAQKPQAKQRLLLPLNQIAVN